MTVAPFRSLPILMYHHVSRNPGLVTISPESLEQQMRYLAENQYHCVSPEELEAFVLSEQPLPEKSVMLTFDDGYLDNYVFAYPILKQYGLRATLFGITNWFGDGPARNINDVAVQCVDHVDCALKIRAGKKDDVMLRWSEIEKMMKDGVFSIQSHTHTHARWDKAGLPPVAQVSALDQDLLQSRQVLKTRLGIDSTHLCWPQGYYTTEYIAAAVEAGFNLLYTTEKRSVTAGCDPQTIGRIAIKDQAGFWFTSQLWIYARPRVAKWYTRIRGY